MSWFKVGPQGYDRYLGLEKLPKASCPDIPIIRPSSARREGRLWPDITTVRKGRYNLQRFIYWHVLKCFWNDDYPREMNIMVNFDWYHPQDAFRYSPDEIRRWFEESQVEIVNFDVIESGISVRGRVR